MSRVSMDDATHLSVGLFAHCSERICVWVDGRVTIAVSW